MSNALQFTNHFHIHYLFQIHTTVHGQNFDYHLKDKESETEE
jgi:hypothetical protein